MNDLVTVNVSPEIARALGVKVQERPYVRDDHVPVGTTYLNTLTGSMAQRAQTIINDGGDGYSIETIVDVAKHLDKSVASASAELAALDSNLLADALQLSQERAQLTEIARQHGELRKQIDAPLQRAKEREASRRRAAELAASETKLAVDLFASTYDALMTSLAEMLDVRARVIHQQIAAGVTVVDPMAEAAGRATGPIDLRELTRDRTVRPVLLSGRDPNRTLPPEISEIGIGSRIKVTNITQSIVNLPGNYAQPLSPGKSCMCVVGDRPAAQQLMAMASQLRVEAVPA